MMRSRSFSNSMVVGRKKTGSGVLPVSGVEISGQTVGVVLRLKSIFPFTANLS
jgi:hypothetical protein